MNQREAIGNFLAQKMGVSRAESAVLPATIIESLVSSPRQGIVDLLAHLARKPFNDWKLSCKVKELELALQKVQSSTSARASRITAAPADGDETERTLDNVITRSEAGFLARENEFRGSLASFKPPAYLNQEDLFAPFQAMRMNQSNLDRNMIRRRRQIRAGTADSSISLASPYHFFYDLKHGHKLGEGESANGIAAFSPMSRTMSLHPDHDASKPLDFLVEYHEMRHANQDANLRIHLMRRPPEAMQQYEAFHTGRQGEKPRLIANDEASAYAYEMESLNVMLHGRLQSGRIPPIAEVAAILGIKRKDFPMLETLLAIAGHYYPEGFTGGDLSERFMTFIIDQHKGMGYDVFVPWSTGGIRKV